MAGLGPFLAGFGPGLADALEKGRRAKAQEQEQQLRSFQLQQYLKQQTQQNQAESAFLNSGDILGGGDLKLPSPVGGDNPVTSLFGGGQSAPSMDQGPSSLGRDIMGTQAPVLKGAGSLAMQQPESVQRDVAAKIATEGGAQHWANFNPKLKSDLAAAGLPINGPVPPEQLEPFLKLVRQDESGGKNVPNFRFDPKHTAGGFYQITNSTWNAFGGPRGGEGGEGAGGQEPVNLARMGPADTSPAARQEGARELMPGAEPAQFSPGELPGGAFLPQSAPPEVREQSDAAARNTASGIQAQMPQIAGQMSIKGLADQIRQRNPGIDDHAVVLTLKQLMPYVSKREQQQFEIQMKQWERQFKIEDEGRSDQRERGKEQRGEQRHERERVFDNQNMPPAREGFDLFKDAEGQEHYLRKGDEIPRGWHQPREESKAQGQILQQPDGTLVRVHPDGKVERLEVPAGTGKMSGVKQSPLTDAQARFWASVLEKGGSLPAGLRRSGVVEQIMRYAGDKGAPGDFIAKHATVQADSASLRNITKMSDSAKQFERLANTNFDVALKEAPDAIPTDLGPFFNRWIEEGDTLLGKPEVPRYVAAIITASNEYAKVMSGSTGTAASTVDSRREARELFSPYLSLPQISQVIAVAKADMANREQELNGQIEAIQARLKGAPEPERKPANMPNPQGGSAKPIPGGKYSVGQIIEKGGKKYRVTGGDMSDPDVEPIQ